MFLKKFVLLTALMFVGSPSIGFSAEPPPTPVPAPVVPTPTPLDEKSVIVILDGKLVHATDVLNPVVTIEGADGQVGLGELVFLQAKLSQELPTFVKAKVFKWSIPKHSFRENSDGSAFFGAGITPDTLPVKVDVSLTYQVGEELLIKTTSKTINVQIGDVNPNPKPPGPDPSPVPPVPPAPPLTDNQKAIYDIAQSTFGKNLSNDDFKKAADMLALDFKNAAQNITDNKYDSFKSFSDDLKNMNQQGVKLLNLDLGKFDGFRTELNNFLFQYYQKEGDPKNPISPNGTGKLAVLSDWIPLINDLATGLKAAGN